MYRNCGCWQWLCVIKMRESIVESCFYEIADGVCPAEMLVETRVETQKTILTVEAEKSGDESDPETDAVCESKKRRHELREYSNERKRPFAECKWQDDIVERILSKLAFPTLFKVRCLSKMWYNKFPLPCGCYDSAGPRRRFHPEMKTSRYPCACSSLSFQHLVSSVSTQWSGYCPLIIGDEGVIGYDSVQKRWLGLPADLRQILGTASEPWLISTAGALFCGVSQSAGSQYNVLVTNVLTRAWKKLPSHPSKRIPSLLNLVSDGSDTYKVFLVTETPYQGPYDDLSFPDTVGLSRRVLCTQVFDSETGTWTASLADVPAATSLAWRSCSVYLDGNVYCLSGDDRYCIDHPLQLWMYNLKKKSWTQIEHPFGQLVNLFTGRCVLFDLTRFQLFACGSKLLIVLALDPEEPDDDLVGMNTLFIFELDPETHIITEKSRGPPTSVLGNSEHITSDGANIYFCTMDLLVCYPVLVYNVKSGEWSCLAPDFKTAQPLTNKRWAVFAFQPGLNPFVAP